MILVRHNLLLAFEEKEDRFIVADFSRFVEQVGKWLSDDK